MDVENYVREIKNIEKESIDDAGVDERPRCDDGTDIAPVQQQVQPHFKSW